MPHYMTLVGTEYEGPMAVADYLHDEADSAKLLDELAEVREEDIWPVWSIRVEREDDWWEVELRTWRTVGLPYMHSRQHDPDRKRAIVLAAYEASRVSCEVRK